MNAQTLTDSKSLNAIQQNLRQSVDSEQLQQWIAKKTTRVSCDLGIDWLGIFLALGLAAWIPVWWSYSIAFIVVGCCQYALFILGHDALHYSLHPNRNVNDFLAKWLIYGPMFMGLEDARRNHLEHHKYLGTEADPDRYLHSLSNKNTFLEFLLFCSGLSTFGKTLLKVTPFSKLHDPTLARDKTKPNSSKALFENSLWIYFKQRVSVVVFQLLIVSFFIISTLPWWAYFVLWISPIYFFVFLPDEIRAFCDHAILILPENLGDRHRLASFCPPWWEAKFFSPHNMNYHGEHHLFPSVPYYNLPQIHQWIKDSPYTTVRGSYLLFLFEVVRTLPLQVQESQPAVNSKKG